MVLCLAMTTAIKTAAKRVTDSHSDFYVDFNVLCIRYRNGKQVCSIVQDVDGFWKAYDFAPGVWDEYGLRGIVTCLENANRVWNLELERFSGQSSE
jgi:hypothetical protein